MIKAIPSAYKGMTNGEVIKAVFPNFHTDEMSHTVWVGYDAMSFHRDWWDSPYEPAKAREVLYSGDGYADGKMVYDMAECPNCGREFEDGDETWNCNFCPDCGQALEWEKDDVLKVIENHLEEVGE